ncbi:MAG: antitoxin VbhA family protein [Endomicrobium sp.]|jgi:hypothetical protein|nr:antitoxin VbhA family protein [Endomicrobium sp.]
MAYRSVVIDKDSLTINGVHFSDLGTLISVSNAIGSNMFEGFEPTKKNITIIRDYVSDKITLKQLAKKGAYV